MSGGDVQRELEQLRADIYGGRGPGIGDDELRRRTTLRPCVGDLPTAWLREELRLRTMRLRGDRETAQLEEHWAGAQFETRCPDRW
jgi:hypothetical protein